MAAAVHFHTKKRKTQQLIEVPSTPLIDTNSLTQAYKSYLDSSLFHRTMSAWNGRQHQRGGGGRANQPPTTANPSARQQEQDTNNALAGKRRRQKSSRSPSFTPASPQTPPPKRGDYQSQAQHQQQQYVDTTQTHQPPAALMTVLVGIVHMYDAGGHPPSGAESGEEAPSALHHPHPHVEEFSYQPPVSDVASGLPPKPEPSSYASSVAVCRLPSRQLPCNDFWMELAVVDKSKKSPSPSIIKYWNQRRRLFSRFDQGIQLDEQGWFSVTPEQIANHVAHRLYEELQISQQHCPPPQRPYVILDAFCGCGGNAIAFAQLDNVQVIAVDVDRSKLQRAAHNAAIYEIPPSKLVFCECNVLFLLEYCYKHGDFVLDQPLATPEAAMALMNAMPPPVASECIDGFQIGGIELLPRNVDAVFMDPPWGGVDYEVFGKQGYDLTLNMKIERPKTAASLTAASTSQPTNNGALEHDFFDQFVSEPRTKQDRKAQFNCTMDDNNCVNGTQLVALAASVTKTHLVVYDVPRNTNRLSIGKAALGAGYRGNCKLEEHYLNGRMKTVTAYFGNDYRQCLPDET